MDLSRLLIKHIFNRSGISVGSSKDNDVVINDSSYYRDVLLKGSLGLGNSYMDGKWNSDSIDDVIYRLLSSGTHQRLAPLYNTFRDLKGFVMNRQSRQRARKVIENHYDLPSEFYASFLDSSFQYTCAFFDGTNDLEQAQINKMELICQKLKLKPGQRVLDIGGGWGGLARYMADHYGVKPTVVTLSQEQADHMRRVHGDKIEVLLCDYRDLPDELEGAEFDAVSAVGVMEHVGHKNYGKFMEVIDSSLKRGGRFLLHTLYTHSLLPQQNPWVDEHIFPNGELPPIKSIRNHAQNHFHELGMHELTPNYTLTLQAWDRNLSQAIESGKVKLSKREQRKWHYYFMSYAGAFRAERVRVGQFLYEKKS
ncbi:methyltransferase domain-containing protein [Candidatus Woesearchaeota archaeon]|jgi:cyclopropane-fatty-acyl-phospholipid synthase|nr:methyltransferase domain-containing protein [Candidatus Woesearchaeota archaeon]MBT3537839.1 methyltransferase domain-containing protein [Candidatus Woesearchaeota archaeon]MBT4697970.1 methyltransferase domain-containing protein [Candidatus Woesearchaeota archaeon]MBT7105508.1 methyltransferase domain-containing protein [Candidatus Woesearchaeota archaeon]MBT7931698.1 methyltransferase domain-containing protein [Candidatus Woesearchaeota archaeon]